MTIKYKNFNVFDKIQKSCLTYINKIKLFFEKIWGKYQNLWEQILKISKTFEKLSEHLKNTYIEMLDNF